MDNFDLETFNSTGGTVFRFRTSLPKVAYLFISTETGNEILSAKSVNARLENELFISLYPGMYRVEMFVADPVISDLPKWEYWGQSDIAFEDLEMYTYQDLM